MILDWALAVASLLIILYCYLTWHYDYWRARGVYTLPGSLPGIGHMWEAFTFKKSHPWLHCEMYHKTKGHPAVGFYDSRRPALLVRDLSLVQAVLVSDFSSFHDNTIITDESIDPHISKNPFVLKGQKWKTLRQKLNPGLSAARIKNMFHFMEVVSKEFNRYMENHLNEDTNLNHVTGLFTSEVVARCAFAVEGNAFKDQNSEFYQQGKKMWDGSIYNPIFIFLFTFFPFINKILRKSFIPKEMAVFFSNLIQQAADYRDKNPDKVSEDYLQYLFNLTKKDPEFTLDDVVAQSLTFFTDGFETTSAIASFMLYELTVNPSIQDQLREEVLAMEAFSFENISALPLLNRVFNETLRKYSVISMVRECTRHTELRTDGFSCKIEKGTHVAIPVNGIHNDPDIYPSPEIFDPDRFLPENIKTRHPMAYLGFGSGPRMCIGYRLGTAQVKVLVTNILRNFRLLKCNKTAEKLNMLKTVFFPVPDGGLWVKFEKI